MSNPQAMYAFESLMKRGPGVGTRPYGIPREGNRPGYGLESFAQIGPTEYAKPRRYGHEERLY